MDKLLGKAIKRKEDPRFLTGRGRYVDDLNFRGQAHVVMVRSPYAHAHVTGIDKREAEEMDGVLAVLTGQDLLDAGLGSIPTGWLLPDIKLPPHYSIAVGKVRHQGEIVAAVVAESVQAAEDAAERVQVSYEELPAVAHPVKALEEGAPQIHQDAPGNLCFEWELGDREATERAFQSAAKTVKLELRNNRLIPNAIEPRASIGDYNPGTDEYTLYTTSQNPHVHRLILAAFVMGIPEHKLRVVSPDVGGGFGSKIYQYPEEVIVLHASKLLGRPVKWTAKRAESFLTDSHARDHYGTAELAVDENGKVTALRADTVANMGAYLTLFAPAIPTYLYACLLSGTYQIPAIHCRVRAPFTNTTPVDAYRGAGRPEATYVVERLMSRMAAELGEDPAQFRRKNFIRPDQFPYQTPVALQYDSGNYEAALDKALKMVDYEGFKKEREDARREGRYLGIGFSCFVEACGLAPSSLVGSIGAQAGQWESAVVRVHPTGKVEVLTGSHSHGQGHETVFAQIVADELGVPLDDIAIIHGDTGKLPFGWGSYGSRSGPVGGSAVVQAAGKVKAKAKKIAAHLLEARTDDIEAEGGHFSVKGSPDKKVGFGDIALQAHLAHNYPSGLEPGLEESAFFDPTNFTYPFGTHIAIVEVFPDSGEVKLLRYASVDDCGNMMNPLIVEGQVHGGIAQGVAQALWENAQYDDNGQLQTASFMDYAMPRTTSLPSFELGHTVTPAPQNPLGVKGIGEAGCIASTAAAANAVIDALSPFGILHMDMPMSAPRVWRAIQEAQPAQAAD
jgi:aerobic carbon-monoxide dehydrogenase large subunit